jgi:hypothetical protein
MTSEEKQATWLDDAARIVALRRDAGDGDRSADHAGLEWLRDGRASNIREKLSPRERVSAWADLIEQPARRDTFLLFAYFPDQVLTGFPSVISQESRWWSTLVELYEAWFRLASSGGPDIVEERGWNLAAAYFARTRWLLLSLPFRPDWKGRIGALSLQRVNDKSGRILTLTLQARDDWLAVLAQIDDLPRLKQDIDVEAEAEVIATLRITRKHLREASPELNLEADRVRVPDSIGAEATRYAISRLLLPRFALGRVWRIVYAQADWPGRVAGAITAVACVPVLVLLAIGLLDPADGMLAFAPVLALAWYGLVALAGAICPATAWPWLIRQPASAAVGLLALAFAPPDWWHDTGHVPHVAVWAALLLAAVSLGYLYLEAGSHDVLSWRRAWRPPLVAVFGYGHAVLVSVIGLRFLLPEFAPRPAHPPYLSCWWHPSGCGPAALQPWLLVVVAASWSFAAGVFLQIIWDDQPVTAPLAHVSWRRGS